VESPTEAYVGLYLCLCRKPRLDSVLSKDPQLAVDPARSLPVIQRLFRQDVEEDFNKKLRAINLSAPERSYQAARPEADRRVAVWLLGEEAAASLLPESPRGSASASSARTPGSLVYATAAAADDRAALSMAMEPTSTIALEEPLVAENSGPSSGDFQVIFRWQPPTQSWGTEAALPVEVGEDVYISWVDEQRWALGMTLGDNRRGWLPYDYCRRRVYSVVAAFAEDGHGYCNLELGERVVVHFRDGNGWAYGVKHPRGNEGWFPIFVLAPATARPVAKSWTPISRVQVRI